MNTSRNFNKLEEQTNNAVAARNFATTAEGYIASLSRPRTSEYVAMPDGTVEFIRRS